MHVIHSREPIINVRRNSLFLAGPTPRSKDVESWRPKALAYLENRNADITVFVPEDRDGTWNEEFNYDAQVDWEDEALHRATVILFWIPRDLKTLPGFTTNVEFGAWKKSGKIVLGWPQGASKMSYFAYYANRLGIPRAETLEETIKLALDMLEKGVSHDECTG